MKKILLAVDDTKGTKNSFSICSNLCACLKPESITLLYVEKFEGRSLIDEMLGDAEIATLKEVLTGSEYKDALDKKAHKVLNFYKNSLKESGETKVSTVIREGHPADEILKAVEEIGADLIMLGSRGKRVTHTFMGSVSREVVNRADVPVFVAKAK
jgi:nucleotide-binding universal stress UspA family protein